MLILAQASEPLRDHFNIPPNILKLSHKISGIRVVFWVRAPHNPSSTMKHTKRVCMRICLLRAFFNHAHDRDSPNTRTYALDSRDWTLTTTRVDYWRMFCGSPSDCGSALHLEKIQQSMSSFTFTHCNLADRVRGFPKELNKYLTSFVFSFTKITLVGPSVQLVY